MKILMVCLGNICRSPLAEGIMKAKIEAAGKDWTVDSAGTGAWHAGELPDPRSMEVAKKNQIDISDQRARQFITRDFDDFDMIYAMDASNYREILAMANSEEEKEKVKMILNEVYPNENRRVPDPYYGGPSGFDDVFALLDEACTVILEKLD